MIDAGEHIPDKNAVIVLQVKLDNNKIFSYTQELDEEKNDYLKNNR